MSYELIGVTGAGDLIAAPKRFANAPNNTQIGKFAAKNRCAFVMRYYPSRKGWMISDTRTMVEIRVNGGRSMTYKFLRGHIVYPSREAAEMVLLHKFSWPQPVKQVST